MTYYKNLSFLLLFIFFSLFILGNSQVFLIEEKEENNISVLEPLFSLESGFYSIEDVREISIESNNTVYYTLDSTDPSISETAKIYTKPIPLNDRSSEENIYSKYQHEDNSPYSIMLQTKFIAGSQPFDKATIVRAISQNENGEFSNIVTKTYFIMNSDKLKFYTEIPVISLVTNPDNLFDKDKGIYVSGQQYVDWLNGPDYDPQLGEFYENNVANFFSHGKEWERESIIQYFKKGGKLGFSQNMGIRIKGASTRNHANKSFNVYCRKKYGKSKLKYELIKNNHNFIENKITNKYESFSLRGTDLTERKREIIIQSSLKDIPDLASYDIERGILFIDGEFWGLYDIMERASSYYIQTNYGIPADTVSLIKNNKVEEGPESELKELRELNNYCKNNSLADLEKYKYVTSKIDIDSIIYHYSAGFYLGIWDWPDHNYFMWKNNGEKIDGNKFSDGKWRFGSFDFDFCSGLTYASYGKVEGYAYDYFQKMEKSKNGFPSAIFNGLLNNTEFKQKFIDSFYLMADDIYEANKMKKVIDEVQNKYLKYSKLGSWRWRSNHTDTTFKDFAEWSEKQLIKELDVVRDFFNNRKEYAIKQMKKYLEIKGDENNK